LILKFAVISPINQVLQASPVPLLQVVTPNTISGVMTFDELLKLIGEFAFQACLRVIVDIVNNLVEGSEVVCVVDLLLVDVGIDHQGPYFLVVPFQVMTLDHQFNQQLLVVDDFCLPLFDQNWLELSVQQIDEVRAWKSAVLSESDH
jgi:hypothetical protein